MKRVCGIVVLPINISRRKLMAIIIKVLDKNTLKPKSGISVSYIRTSGIGGFGSTRSTNESGCVSYQVDPCHAIVTIKGVRKPEQRLENGDGNVFYI